MSLLVQVGQVSAADVTTKARDIDPLIASECVLLNFIMFNGCWDVVGIWQYFRFYSFDALKRFLTKLDLIECNSAGPLF